jgi:hypothetical protein
LSKYPGFISYVDRSKAKSKKVPPSETLVKDTVVDNNQNLIDLLFGLLSNHKVIITIELRKNT